MSISINNDLDRGNLNKQDKKVIDLQKKFSNKHFRKSSLIRITLGTLTTSSICLLFSLAIAKYRNYNFSYVKNWVKGGTLFSFLFYTGNEFLFAASNFYKIYTNFWINSSVMAYTLSKVHYRYLIRNNQMKWYIAIKYSHKCFLYFLVINLILDFIIKIIREIALYDAQDLFDILKDKYMDKDKNEPNFAMDYDELEKLFMKTFHLFNSDEKRKLINLNKVAKRYVNEGEGSSLLTDFRLNTVNFYDLYKNKKI